MKTMLSLITIFAVSAAFAAQSGGEKIFYSKCAGCHSTALPLSKKKSQDEWSKTIDKMKHYGMSISGSESDAVASFLAGRK